MRNARVTIAILIASAVECRPQVLAPAEILDPAMRELQQKHFAELKAAAVDITTHNYPYKFSLSRTLDISEAREQVTDQRSLHFAKFQDRTVLQITGNYFASYSGTTVDTAERIKRTFADVMLPILRAAATHLEKDPSVDAFAVEVSYHVRKRVLDVTVENSENVAVIVPCSAAATLATSNDSADGLAALKQASIYVDSRPFAVWSPADAPQQIAVAPSGQPVPAQPAPALASAVAPTPTPAPAASRDLSAEALQKAQSPYQDALDRMVSELDSQAHFVSYAPPILIAFRNMSYLQLSVTTDLPSSESGSQYRLAALAFDRHVSHLIRPVLGYFKDNPQFDGIDFSSTVKITGVTAESSVTQSVEFFFPMTELRRYERYDITGQQLIDAGFVLINGERVSLDLQSAESGAR